MVISSAENYLFIHIPKTAGTSLTHAMLKGTGVSPGVIEDAKTGENHKVITHTGALQMKEILREGYSQYFTFSVVRNPWDRMVSLFNFKIQSAQDRLTGARQRKEGTTEEGDKREIAYLSRLGFERWLFEGECDNELYGESLTKLPQLCWLTDNEGQIIVQHIAKFEELDKEIKQLQKKVRMDLSGPTQNPSVHAPWALYYNQDTFECVKERFQADINAFDYAMTWEQVLENQTAMK